MKLKKTTQKAEMFILVTSVQLIAREIDCNQFVSDLGFYNMDQPRYCYWTHYCLQQILWFRSRSFMKNDYSRNVAVDLSTIQKFYIWYWACDIAYFMKVIFYDHSFGQFDNILETFHYNQLDFIKLVKHQSINLDLRIYNY